MRSAVIAENSTFIVAMDLPDAQSGRMPRAFYRRLKDLQGVARLQKSVYLVTGVTSMKDLVALGRGCGFDVQAFQVTSVTVLTGEKKKGERRRSTDM